MVFIWLKASDKVKLFRLPWKFTKRNQCHGKNCLQIFVSLMSLVIDGRKSWKKLKSVLLYYLVLTTAQYEFFYDALRENVGSFKVGIFCTCCKILNLNLKLTIGFLIYVNWRFHWDRILKVSKLKVQNPISKIHIFLTFAFFDSRYNSM